MVGKEEMHEDDLSKVTLEQVELQEVAERAAKTA